MTLGTEASPQQPGQDIGSSANLVKTGTPTGELLAPVGDRVVQPPVDECLILTEAQLEAFGNMYFQLQQRLLTRSLWVEDRVADRQAIVQDASEELAPEHSLEGYATTYFFEGPREEVVYALASCIIAGASQIENQAETVLTRRTFFVELFNEQEKQTLLRLATAMKASRLPAEVEAEKPEDIHQEAAADTLLVTEIEQARRAGASPLFLLALQAFRIGATIENTALGDKNLEIFLDSLLALQQ